jgi:hypothetical protein
MASTFDPVGRATSAASVGSCGPTAVATVPLFGAMRVHAGDDGAAIMTTVVAVLGIGALVVMPSVALRVEYAIVAFVLLALGVVMIWSLVAL